MHFTPSKIRSRNALTGIKKKHISLYANGNSHPREEVEVVRGLSERGGEESHHQNAKDTFKGRLQQDNKYPTGTK